MTEPEILNALQEGMAHHQAGRLAGAEALYRRVLAQEPDNSDALHLLGVAAHQQGRHDEGADLIARAIAAEPSVADYHNNLGEALASAGRVEAAAQSYRRAIELEPNRADASYNLGRALARLGKKKEAIDSYRQAVRLRPDLPEANFNLGVLLLEEGTHEEADAPLKEAERLLRSAVRARPAWAEAHFSLGSALQEQGRFEEAFASYQQAVAVKPDYAPAHTNLGAIYKDMGRAEEAAACFERALAADPNHFQAMENLGIHWRQKRDIERAMQYFERSKRVRPDRVEPDNQIARTLRDQGNADAAIPILRKALKREPRNTELHLTLGHCFMSLGRQAEALAAYREALAINPKLTKTESTLLFDSHYDPARDVQAGVREHLEFGGRHAAALASERLPHANDRNPDRRLNVGYVSADFRGHSVSYFLEPILAAHDKSKVKLFAYSEVAREDSTTDRLRTYFDVWRPIRGLPDRRVAELVREDRIDLLVDLGGHSGNNRLLVFARKPAPVQISYLGYPDTTGLPTIDYRLTDSLADPPGTTESLHSERLVRIDPCAWCYQPSPEAPEVGPLPCEAAGHVTFGSFNNIAKVNEPLIALWSRLLLAAPNSRLLLKSRSFAKPPARQRLHDRFAVYGIAPDRLELASWQPTGEGHLGLYNRVDVALDTFPYHGTTTTCEALWMGVPVITRAGNVHVSRVGVSLLTNVGLAELIASDEQDYVRIATGLAADPVRLAELRRSLRDRVRRSPLTDRERFTRSLESAYREMWKSYCGQSATPAPANGAQAILAEGVRLAKAGRAKEAESHFRRAAELRPDDAEPLGAMGNSLMVQGRHDEALRCYERATAVQPDNALALFNHGAALQSLGRHEEAMPLLRRAVELRPNQPGFRHNLGVSLQALRRFEEALECFERCAELDPGNALALNNRGNAEKELGRMEAAIASYRRAIEVLPDFGEAYSNLANVLDLIGREGEAIACHRKAAALSPRLAQVHCNLGVALKNRGQLDEAVASFKRAIELNPDHADAHFNKAMALMLRGDLAEGCAEYEWRWRWQGRRADRGFSQPLWDGLDPSGKTILLHAEQGLGDTLQFVRYAPLLARRGATVIVQAQAALRPVLQTVPGVSRVIPIGEPVPPFDAHLSMLSLPRAFGTTLANVPGEAQYVSADPKRSREWQARLAGHSARVKVGIVWAGNPSHQNDRSRSAPLAAFAPLSAVRDVSFYSLQKGLAAAQVGEAPASLRLIDLAEELNDFADTAALLENLDLVISVDTSIVHLAGAMNRPVWTLLAFSPDWRWMLERDDSPWYPSMRLFRQSRPRDWGGVMARVTEALKNFVPGQSAAPKVRSETSTQSGRQG